jgi:charged multivesicular body protein 1
LVCAADGAKIYAQNAIRKKNEQLNYLRLSSRLDAVITRLDQQSKMQNITRSMAGITKALDKALAANNMEKVAGTMDLFEKQFENLDIQSEFVENAMNNQAVLSTPEDDVNLLLQQVADEHNLELGIDLPGATVKHQVAAQTASAADPEADLTTRLAELRVR